MHRRVAVAMHRVYRDDIQRDGKGTQRRASDSVRRSASPASARLARTGRLRARAWPCARSERTTRSFRARATSPTVSDPTCRCPSGSWSRARGRRGPSAQGRRPVASSELAARRPGSQSVRISQQRPHLDLEQLLKVAKRWTGYQEQVVADELLGGLQGSATPAAGPRTCSGAIITLSRESSRPACFATLRAWADGTSPSGPNRARLSRNDLTACRSIMIDANQHRTRGRNAPARLRRATGADSARAWR